VEVCSRCFVAYVLEVRSGGDDDYDDYDDDGDAWVWWCYMFYVRSFLIFSECNAIAQFFLLLL
jgi:hypothetical protein